MYIHIYIFIYTYIFTCMYICMYIYACEFCNDWFVSKVRLTVAFLCSSRCCMCGMRRMCGMDVLRG